MIAGFVYLLDENGNKIYGKKYISKLQRERILKSIVKFFKLENCWFNIQIAPYVNKDQSKFNEIIDGLPQRGKS